MENDKQNLMPKDQVAVILEEIKSQNKVFGEKLDGVSEKLELVIEDIDGLKSDMMDVKFRLKTIEADVKGKLDSKADGEIVENHEERIVKLEKAAASA